MRRVFTAIILLALLPSAVQAQADAKLIAKAEKGDPAAMVQLGECYENAAGVPLDSVAALKWFQKAADMGYGEAWLRVSRYYLRSSLVPRDTARYYAIRKEWAEKGLPNALAAMNTIYEMGLGVAVDSAKAFEYLQQAVKKGSPWGYRYLGYAYAYGEYGLPKDEKKAVAFWQKAWKAKELGAGGLLTSYYNARNDYKTAWKYVSEAYRWGEPWARCEAARMTYLGMGVPENEAEAQQIVAEAAQLFPMDEVLSMAGYIFMTCDSLELRDESRALAYWHKGAAKNGSECMARLAAYHEGLENYDSAKVYYTRLSEEKKSPYYAGNACFNMSRYVYNGFGCEASDEAAMRWLQKGADEYKNADCARVLAAFYEEEEYKDLLKAAQYYRQAADLGDMAALESLGKLYADNGNADRAMECYREMVEKGNVDGYYQMAVLTDSVKYLETGVKKGSSQCADVMGSICESGNEALGIKQDYKKAAGYYEKSGSAFSKYRRGFFYLDGRIGKQKPKELAQGMALVEEAANEGWLDAIYFLGLCHESGEYVDSVDKEKAVEYFSLLAENNVAAGQNKMGIYYEMGWGGLEVDTAKAIEYYRLAADQDYPLAVCFLGDMYRMGCEALPQDKAEAFRLYTHAHELGAGTGTYYVGRSYLEGCGVDIDTAQAIPYLRQAAEIGVGNAAYKLADMYNFGRGGLEANGDTALHYYLMGHENGSGDASCFIGRLLLNEGNYETALQYLMKAAQRGNAEGTALLGVCLIEGLGTEADPESGCELLRRSLAIERNAQAYASLGLATLQGNGCPQDETLAKNYLDTAVSMGHEKSVYYLALCYLNGWGCQPDTAMAISYLERASDNGNIRAINELGDLYEEQEDFKNAVLYYEKGVTLGSLQSYCNLGYCYQEGTGVVLNSQKAFELYMVAADHEYIRGYLMVAQSYMNGMGVEQSFPEAMKWLEKAAEAGNPTAMYYLGAIYEEGEEGVKADLKKAKAWYKKAAAEGYAPAQAALERMK